MSNVGLLIGVMIVGSGAVGCREELHSETVERTAFALESTSNEDTPQGLVDKCLGAASKAGGSSPSSDELVQDARMRGASCLAKTKAASAAFYKTLKSTVAKVACEQRSREELAVVAYLMTVDSTVASTEAIACLIGSGAAEDVVVWDALDAWSSLGRPEIPAISALASRAQLFNTRRRFMKPDEVARQLREMPIARELTAEIIAGNGEEP